MGPHEEFVEFDRSDSWGRIYHQIRSEASLQHDFSLKDSRHPDFRSRNRYRDVSPYDHSRVRLERDGVDYINANLVEASEANRRYILAQGPLPSTCGHFWLTVWEQNTHAILMLNRVIERGRVKCHQYFPTGSVNEGEDEMVFSDVDLKVTFISEEDQNYFTIRTLRLHDMRTGNEKEVLQFHYTTWPDFGVPQSPAAFLNFLMSVRSSGALDKKVGPPVIHCSAGIGRSGTFCLVDTCLVMIEQQQDASGISILDTLMDMRRYRMGLIQTPDQLRFSYLAIIEGCKRVMRNPPPDIFENSEVLEDESEDEDNEDYEHPSSMQTTESESSPDVISDDIGPPPAHAAPPPPNGLPPVGEAPPPLPPRKFDSNGNPLFNRESTDNSAEEAQKHRGSDIRRRNRAERIKNTKDQLEHMKKKQEASEKWRERKKKWPPSWMVGVAVAVVAGGIFAYYFMG